jgi:acyl-CoA thioester hydrolase
VTDPAEAAAGVPIAGPAIPNVYEAQVRWSDADVMGHVNHARYLSFFEDARMTLLSTSPAGLAGVSGSRGYIAARVAVDYLWAAEFRPGLMLRVETMVSRIGATSWTFDQHMYDDDHHVAHCECVLVGYSYADGKPRLLADDEREFWHQFLVTGAR